MEKDESSKMKIIVYILVVIFSCVFIFVGNKICRTDLSNEETGQYYKARINSIDKIDKENYSAGDEFYENKIINFTAEILSGDKKGQIVKGTQNIDEMYASQPNEVKKDSNVIVGFINVNANTEPEWVFIEYNRSDTLIWLVIAFLALILILGRKKGFSTILSLIFTILAIFLVFIPSILKGYNIYLTTIIVSVFIIFMSLLIINGANKKTWCAILGNLGGVAVAGIIAIIMSNVLKITGIVDQEYVFLMTAQININIDLIAIVWAGIVIGSLGAIMDVAMSIASALNELSENMEEKTFSKMLKSGMNIGRDAIGTMTNTLILAYIGSSLATVLLFMIYNKNTLYLFNMEMIVVEVLQAIVGSMGILFAVPSTAIFAAYIFTKNIKNKNISSQTTTIKSRRDIKF